MQLKFISRMYSNIARHVVDLMAERMSSDLELARRIAARDDSARYVTAEMTEAQRFRDRESLLLDAVQRTKEVKGCICEFGVWTGGSLRLLADAAPERDVHGFDSFEGLPANWRPWFSKGAFKTSVPMLRQPNVRLHKGWFDATLPPFIKQLQQPISLAHIDCDLYSSTRTVLEHIIPRLADGAVMVFDEYFNYPGWEAHEHKALLEAVRARQLKVRYLAFNYLGEQVMVAVDSKRATRGTRRV